MEQIQLTEDELEKLNINLESKADEKINWIMISDINIQ